MVTNLIYVIIMERAGSVNLLVHSPWRLESPVTSLTTPGCKEAQAQRETIHRWSRYGPQLRSRTTTNNKQRKLVQIALRWRVLSCQVTPRSQAFPAETSKNREMNHTLLHAVRTSNPQNATGTNTGYSVLLLSFRVTYHSAIPTGNYFSTWKWGTAITKP